MARTCPWDVLDNLFSACSGSQPVVSTGSLDVPYEYTLDDAEDLPASVPESAGVVR